MFAFFRWRVLFFDFWFERGEGERRGRIPLWQSPLTVDLWNRRNPCEKPSSLH